jgi:hypothetical protein
LSSLGDKKSSLIRTTTSLRDYIIDNHQRRNPVMKRMLYLACIAARACLCGACTKSVERAQQDVQRARNQAAQDVQNKREDLRQTQQDAGERVARQERRVEDAARRGNENVIKQERELEDAQRAEARKDTIDSTATHSTPPITDRSGTTTNRPAHVDVNVNRVPGGGVTVDVNRTP